MVIISAKSGQLANRIFVFAHFIAFSAETGIPISNPAFEEYARYFRSTSRDLFCRYPEKRTLFRSDSLRWLVSKCLVCFMVCCPKPKIASELVLRHDERFDLEDPKNLVKLSRRIVFVKGWKFRARNLLDKHRSVVLKYFEPLDKYKDNVRRLLVKGRRDCDLLMGVHVRRGDYKVFLDGRYYYEMEDYKQFVRQTIQLFPGRKVRFLVCSDERLLHDDFKEFDYLLGSGHPVEDLYSLAECDYIIGPPSTFTMWASFYGNVPLFSIHDKSIDFDLSRFVIFGW